MKLKWFECRHSVCKECGVHFEPVYGFESRWGDLCKQHRTPVMERDSKRDRVIAWASANWEKLIDQVEQENTAKNTAYNAMAQQTQMSNLGVLGGLGNFR